jgi:hypothetical protein
MISMNDHDFSGLGRVPVAGTSYFIVTPAPDRVTTQADMGVGILNA